MENNFSKIKSFIYLDEEKMFSISSQLFEGVTDFFMQENTVEKQENESQKGQFLSGRLLADMMLQSYSRSEKRYLHDFAFNIFEKELEQRQLLYDISPSDTLLGLQDKNLVRVKGQIFFYDYDKMNNTIDNFNELGAAFAKVTRIATQQTDQLNQQIKNTNDREKKNQLKNQKRRIDQITEQYLKETGLMLDKDYVQGLSTILHYGYSERFQVNLEMKDSNLIFSSAINERYLKESESLLVSKFSRQTERDFTILGILTQVGKDKTKLPEFQGNDLKAGIYTMNERIADIERQFNGRAQNECVIDPIAIFTLI